MCYINESVADDGLVTSKLVRLLIFFWEVEILDQEVNEQFIPLAWEVLDGIAGGLWFNDLSIFQSSHFPTYLYTLSPVLVNKVPLNA